MDGLDKAFWVIVVLHIIAVIIIIVGIWWLLSYVADVGLKSVVMSVWEGT